MTDTERIVTNSAAQARDDRAHKRFARLAWIGMAGVLVLAVAVGYLLMTVNSLAGQQSTAAVAAEQLAEQVRGLGATPVVAAPTPVAGATGQRGAKGETGPGPDQTQIDAAVSSYLEVHPPAPGKSATATQVSAAVGAYLGAHPPAPGRPPTAEEIAGAVSTYCAGHGGCAGPAGTNGAAGQPATDSQVATAVAAYCGQDPSPCAGPAGPAGTDGADGQPGATGPAGATGSPPAGWTYSDVLGVEHTCTRDNADDSAPTYHCS